MLQIPGKFQPYNSIDIVPNISEALQNMSEFFKSLELFGIFAHMLRLKSGTLNTVSQKNKAFIPRISVILVFVLWIQAISIPQGTRIVSQDIHYLSLIRGCCACEHLTSFLQSHDNDAVKDLLVHTVKLSAMFFSLSVFLYLRCYIIGWQDCWLFWRGHTILKSSMVDMGSSSVVIRSM